MAVEEVFMMCTTNATCYIGICVLMMNIMSNLLYNAKQ